MRTIAIAAAMMLAACAANEPISYAERSELVGPVIGPHSQCVDRATTAMGLPRETAAEACNCLRTAIISNLNTETVRALRSDAVQSQAVTARIEADVARVSADAMRQCGFAR